MASDSHAVGVVLRGMSSRTEWAENLAWCFNALRRKMRGKETRGNGIFKERAKTKHQQWKWGSPSFGKRIAVRSTA